MRTYDVLIVGAGPAGSTAARLLAGQGFDVLILDKSDFPRHKPCGGALSPKAYSQLDFDISDTVKSRVRRTQIKGQGKRAFALEFKDAEIWITSRDELDLRLLERALQAGASFKQGEAAVTVLDDGRAVQTPYGEYRCRVLVGADGCDSVVARALGLDEPRPRRLRALHFEAPMRGEPKDEAVLDFDCPGGYAWLFPKGDRFNAGICTREPGWSLRPRLEAFLRREGLVLEKGIDLRSRPIPIGGGSRPLHRANVLLVGDAAGLADPLLGEGIAYAIMSARLAAQAIAAFLKGETPDLAGYSDRIRRTLQRDLWGLSIGAALFYRFTALSLTLLRNSPSMRRLAINILSGQKSISGIWTNPPVTPSSTKGAP
ncbi:MAG: geranylgeranyl reductase family protein [Dehalococcoidia bacterium]|nr:geranylgeranyl reductase family protein [Dehalococcoidia bacterium]